MYQDLYQYLQWLLSNIQTQEKRIAALEQALQKMQNDLKQIGEKPTIHVDTIEYKFDQLKVETLEGTLSIGLNPNDLSGIEDFAIQGQSLNTPISPKDQMQRSMKIEEAIYRYLEIDLPQIIEDTEKQLRLQPNESYLAFIKQDIIKQLPNRIEYHLKSIPVNEQSEENKTLVENRIIELLKQEIHNGVYTFFNNLPDNVKGMNIE
ncbi:spore gernimation protein [Bacillus salipaludis]|uniref:Spore germination protein GerPC n=1 Tax=Bacillus salipaludis TaxID=2547811 RepID=A0A4V3AT10_9BACI|nr:spore germination protein GerPC [Bacillus salipaludis]MDQ6596501.1 spore germination protein GerPC [Bacillus salipaludis]TDK57098.1 spore gernimation protein [Bacillus salipaludis]